MHTQCTAIIKQDGDWWLGWIEEIPGANAQEKSKDELLVSLRDAARDVLELSRRDAVQTAKSDGLCHRRPHQPSL